MINYDKEGFRKICEKYGLSLVILYGSYAKNTAVADSDIDLGFLGDPQIIKEKYFDILNDFSGLLGDKFDPVFLNGAESMITYHVAGNGKVLYEKTKGLFNAFRVTAVARYMDTKKFRLLEKAYVKSAAVEVKNV